MCEIVSWVDQSVFEKQNKRLFESAAEFNLLDAGELMLTSGWKLS